MKLHSEVGFFLYVCILVHMHVHTHTHTHTAILHRHPAPSLIFYGFATFSLPLATGREGKPLSPLAIYFGKP